MSSLASRNDYDFAPIDGVVLDRAGMIPSPHALTQFVADPDLGPLQRNGSSNLLARVCGDEKTVARLLKQPDREDRPARAIGHQHQVSERQLSAISSVPNARDRILHDMLEQRIGQGLGIVGPEALSEKELCF
ncbi:hypothetical protein MKK75_24490 [Methylobacterium sp. J-030]|nr:hypothetical protein [Methylobacterium sp. J-030]MCJ2071920.1 hypothetical protein [Methylobacterium sp. J-030]